MMKLKQFLSASVVAFVLAAAVPCQVNRSFEIGAPGGAPPGWAVTGGSAVISATPDALFPSHGSQYLVVDPTSTGGIPVASHGPHAAGTVGQVTQIVVR